jgi:hypothetical protein
LPVDVALKNFSGTLPDVFRGKEASGEGEIIRRGK